MQLRLLSLLALVTLASCSRPEASTTRTAAATEIDTELDEDSNQAAERQRKDRQRQHRRLQKQVVVDLQRLLEERQGSEGSKLLVFGGKSHEVYLGCLCDRRQPDSVFNTSGEFGSTQSGTSLRNKFAPYGSNNEDTSACNAAASRPPSVVGSDGKSLGLLTLNPSLKRRIAVPSVVEWLGRMCGA